MPIRRLDEITVITIIPPLHEVRINSIKVEKILSIDIMQSITDMSASASVLLSDLGGARTNQYKIGDEISIWLKGKYIFRGHIRDIEKTGDRGNILALRCRDLTGKLQEKLVVDEYTNKEISDIIKNADYGLMRKFPEFTTNNVSTTTNTLSYIKFNEMSVFDCLKELAQIGDASGEYSFWIDTSGDLNFKVKGSEDTGLSYNISSATSNILEYDFSDTSSKSFSVVKVRGGDEELSGKSDTFVADGITKSFLTSFRIKKGSASITGMVENTDYSIDYDNTQRVVTFTTAPTTNKTINYTGLQRVLVKRVDTNATTKYGEKEKVIIDKNITYEQRAKNVAEAFLQTNADTKLVGRITILGEPWCEIGKKITLTITPISITNTKYTIVSLRHSIRPRQGFKTYLTLASQEIVLSEILKEVLADVKEVKLRDMIGDITQEVQILTETITYTESVSYKSREMNRTGVWGRKSVWNRNSVWKNEASAWV